MDHSAERRRYFLEVVAERCGRIEVEGIGFRQHFAGQCVSDSRALLGLLVLALVS